MPFTIFIASYRGGISFDFTVIILIHPRSKKVFRATMFDYHRLYNICALACAVLLIIGIGYYTGRAYSYLFGNFIGACFLGYLAALPFTRKPETKLIRPSVAISLALVGLMLSNYKIVRDTYEVRGLVFTLANSAGPAGIQKALDESNSRTMRATNFVLKAAKEANDELSALVIGLNSAELDSPVAFEKARLEELEHYRGALKSAEIRAYDSMGKIDFIFGREYERIVDFIAPMNFSSDFGKGILDGVKRRHGDYIPYFKKLFELKAAEFQVTHELLSVLIKEYGQYRRNVSGVLEFENPSVVDGFNSIVAKYQNIERALQAHIEHGEKLDTRYRERFQNYLK